MLKLTWRQVAHHESYVARGSLPCMSLKGPSDGNLPDFFLQPTSTWGLSLLVFLMPVLAFYDVLVFFM